MNVPLTMMEFTIKYNVKTNFVEYHSIISKIRKHIEWRDMSLHEEASPVNSALNTMLNLSVKGSSSHILDIAVDKWNDKIGSFSLSRSFNYHHLRYKDTYLKYIQFRTLYHRFYTNETLFKIGIKILINAVFALNM